MTDQTPRTAAGRRLPENAAKAWRDYPAMVDRDAALLRIAAIIEAQARTEALDVEVLGTAMDMVDEEDGRIGVVGRGRKVDRIVARYLAILAGETE